MNNIQSLKDLIVVCELIQMGVNEEKLMPRSFTELNEARSNFILARDASSNEIVGCCSLEIYNPRIAEIRSLYVLKNYRKNGVGASLVRQAVERAKKNGVKEIFAVTDSIQLFQKIGFNNPLDKQRAMFMRL